MWEISMIKRRGRDAFRKNYWKCVIVALILALFVGNNSEEQERGNTIQKTYNYESFDDIEWKEIEVRLIGGNSVIPLIVRVWRTSLIWGIIIISVLLQIFVFNPIEIGGCRFFIENQTVSSRVKTILFPFTCGYYKKMVLVILLRNLYVFLWMLLLLVPGLVKTYEYRMVPYLLAQSPEMSIKEAFQVSKEMMWGQKFQTFILDLSFIGWWILNVFTFGILGIFYIRPYYEATKAELFAELRPPYISKVETTV